MKSKYAIRECAVWVRSCLVLGWPKRSMEDLENIWWKYHDDSGVLIEHASQPAVSANGADAGGCSTGCTWCGGKGEYFLVRFAGGNRLAPDLTIMTLKEKKWIYHIL